MCCKLCNKTKGSCGIGRRSLLLAYVGHVFKIVLAKNTYRVKKWKKHTRFRDFFDFFLKKIQKKMLLGMIVQKTNT